MGMKIEYQIVGRYMSGSEVTAYHLQSMGNGNNGRYTREQVCYMVGKGQVTNCTGQIYQDKVILRGVGLSLESLPVVQESTGELTRTDSLGKVRKGSTVQQALTQLMLVRQIVSGRNTVGYVVSNAGGATKKLSRNDVIKLAVAGRLGNARAQRNGNSMILRGINCNLTELPIDYIETKGTPDNRDRVDKTGGTKIVDSDSKDIGIGQLNHDEKVMAR